MKTSETLHATADLIQVRGWTQKTDDKGSGWWPEPGSTHPVCLEGALYAVTNGNKRGEAYDTLVSFLTDTYPECVNSLTGFVIPFSWNDRPGRTLDEVVSVLRAAAEVSAAKSGADMELTADYQDGAA